MTPYPLQWPANWPRTLPPDYRRISTFRVKGFAAARDSIIRQIRLLGGRGLATTSTPSISIDALRGLGRWGSSAIVDRAFQGFAALPAVPEIDWRVVLELPPHASIDEAKSGYRALAAKHHPDRGGDQEAMSRINRAWEAAQRELGIL